MRYLLFLLLLIAFPALAADITQVKNIPYGPEKLQQLDVYMPKSCGQGGCPVVIWVHGGGWRMGDKNMGGAERLAQTWGSAGAILVAINYRLSPAVTHPAHVQDVAASINWVKQHIVQYGGNSSRIFLLGHSAGAHLVALVATDPQYLRVYNLHPATALAGVFPIDSASYNLTESINERHVGRMVSQAFGTNKEQLERASPLWLVKENRREKYPPFIIAAAGVRDNAVRQMRDLAFNLQRAGANANTLVVDYSRKGQLAAHMQIAKDLADPTSTMTKNLMAAVGLRP